MQANKLQKKIEQQIAEWQNVQSLNPPDSAKWQEASKEIHRLAAIIITNCAPAISVPQAARKMWS